MATLDAMAMMNAVREFDRVGEVNANLSAGQKPTSPNFSAEQGAFVREVVMLGKQRAAIEEALDGA